MKTVAAILFASVLTAFADTPPVIAGIEKPGVEKVSGAILLSELACTACHPSSEPVFAANPGPDLSAVGSRANPAHLQRYLASPAAVKPGTTMPDVLGHLPEAQRDEAARALAHYLATLRPPAAWEQPEPDAVERGRALYHSVGCVACHSPEETLPGSVPLGPLTDKYTRAGLTAFLQEPLAARPAGRMPDLHLEHEEAEDIASYLLREQKAAPPTFQPEDGLAARGKQLFSEHRCHACHSTGEKIASPALADLSKVRAGEGCLSGKRGAWPHYPLSEAQRAAVQTALKEVDKVWTPAEQLEISLRRLNCLACHAREDMGGIAADRSPYFTGREESLGEQGRIPPTLTGVGAKLKGAWMRDVIANGAGVRPAMNTRMPKFGGANADRLVAWFKQLDTLPPVPIDRVARSAKPHQIGGDLAGVKGLNCIACHTFRGRAAALHGPELTTMSERLEENWFHQFLAQPQRFSPLTVMPNYWPDGKSTLPGVLEGNPGQQRDALWQYLSQGPEAREPQGLILEPLFVEVRDEAVIIRRAFPGIGKRGIGVGYPGGINLAFDAAQMRLGSLWSGGFIEASGLWRGQGSGQARLLGKDVVNFPPGPAFAILASPEAAWPALDPEPQPSPFTFQGYTLDARQRPAFRYAIGGFAVEDFSIERQDAAGKLFLERTLRFPAPPPAGMHFRVAADQVLEPRGDREFGVGKNLTIRLASLPLVRSAGDVKELLLPVRGESLRIEYRLAAKP